VTRVVLVGGQAQAGLARVSAVLEAAGIEVREADQPAAVDYVIEAERAQAVVFDAATLEGSLFRRLRRRHASRVWIAWTPSYSSAGTAGLLAGGADEVLNGAMGDEELLARVFKALGGAPGRDADAVVVGPLEINPRTGETSWDGRELELTRREREVLAVLAGSAGRTVPRETLYREVWGFAMARGDRTVDVNVKRIRDKLATAGAAIQIKTRPGVGYRLEVLQIAAEPVVTHL
jgi:DNA-binding response OmpR family regulator